MFRKTHVQLATMALLIHATASFGTAAASPSAGSWASYQVEDNGRAPAITELRISVPGSETVDGREFAWVQLEVLSGVSPLQRIALLASSLGFLTGEGAPEVLRYLRYDEDGSITEYVDMNTGRALLPALGFFERLLPRPLTWSTGDLFFSTGEYLGRRLSRLDAGEGSAAWSRDAVELWLDPEVLVGTARTFRDDGSAPRGQEDGSLDYNYVELSESDYEEMIEAGFNLFRVSEAHLPRVIDRPVFFVFHENPSLYYNLLYRSNYLGAVMYMDEPAVRSYASLNLGEHSHPRHAADEIHRVTAETYEGNSGYGRGFLSWFAGRRGIDLGQLPQGNFPVWEAFAGAAWYELEAGVEAWVHQARLQPAQFATEVREALGVSFPAEAESLIKLHLGLFRGAARWFGARWGVSVYGQMAEEPADLLFPMAYDAGAHFFWLWTSDRGHHVPFDRQLELARGLRDHARLHPRSDPRALLQAARTAIVLPRDTPIDAISLEPGGHPWLAEKSREGHTYRRLLGEALTIVSDLLARNRDFDILLLDSDESLDGYDEVFSPGASSGPADKSIEVSVASNPMRESTTLTFDVASPGLVSVKIFDVVGRLVRILDERTLSAGRARIGWDGLDDTHRAVTSGVYFAQVVAGTARATTKLVVVR